MINILYLHAGAEMYGADKILLELVTGLDKTKYCPIVVLPNDGILRKKLEKANIRTYIIEYPILRRKYFNVKGISRYMSSYLTESKKIMKLLIQLNVQIDIIHVNTTAVLEGMYLKHKLKAKLVWHVHEIIQRPKVVFKVISKFIALDSDKCIAVSDAVKKHLVNTGYMKKGQVKVIYNGVDSEKFSPKINSSYLYDEWNIPQGTVKIGMIGRVNSWKGQDDFLKATVPLLKKYPNLYIFIVGSAFKGEEWREKELQEKIRKQENKNRIIYESFRSDNNAVENFFDFLVLPSTKPDPLPTVVLESMACGKAIVAYRHGGVKEMVKEDYNGIFAEVGNTDNLEKQIETMLNGQYEEMGKNSRQRLLSNFSISSFIDSFSEIYDNLIENRN